MTSSRPSPWLVLGGLKLRQLQVIVAISDASSLTEAAARLCVTPAAVSKALAEVEGLFGQSIFDRGRGRIAPTPLGALLIRSARVIRAELGALAEACDALSSGSRGELRIGVKAVSLHDILARTIAEFSQESPLVRVRLVDGSVAQLLEQVERGELPLLFARLNSSTLVDGLARFELLHDEAVVVASRGHPILRSRRKKLTWPELLGYPWCLPSAGTLMRDHFEELLVRENLALPERYVETAEMSVLSTLFAVSHRLTILPKRVAGRFLPRPLGEVLPIPIPASRDSLGVIWNAGMPLAPAAARFLEIARRLLPDSGAVRPAARHGPR